MGWNGSKERGGGKLWVKRMQGCMGLGGKAVLRENPTAYREGRAS